VYKNKIIFVAPLDWGLGHATRCVPLIRKLSLNNTLILGVTPLTKIIFDDEFPNLKKIDLEPYNISYSKKQSLTLKLLLDFPRIKKVIKKENEQLKHLIKENKIEVVISDNRLGLFNKAIETVYITHQVNIQAGIFSFLANKIHHYYIKKYNRVWIPDYDNNQQSLAGKLSHPSPFKNTSYIGTLSRLEKNASDEFSFDYLFLVSGPEPHRTSFENTLIEIATKTNKKVCLVRGTHLNLETKLSKNITVFDLPNSKILSQLITNSDTILFRSGYSSLMDLHHLNKSKLILIPTPSQPEQIYLAKYWQNKFGAKNIKQSKLKDFEL
jgi:hypothetical protein